MRKNLAYLSIVISTMGEGLSDHSHVNMTGKMSQGTILQWARKLHHRGIIIDVHEDKFSTYHRG